MPKSIDSRHSIDSCIFQLHSWKPFKPHHNTSTSKILDASDPVSSRSSYHYSSNGIYSKRPCLSDRATSFSIDAVDMSKLSLMDEYRPISINRPNGGSYKLFARKRRRKGSRSVSGRSSDRSGTRRCCSIGASAAYGTCSDIPVAVGTDSSGELFVIGNMNWALDVSDGKNSRTTRRDKDGESGVKENLGSGFGSMGGFDTQGNESGYGSEPGYRGDAEFGYDDDFDEEEEDARLLFWGHELRGKFSTEI